MQRFLYCSKGFMKTKMFLCSILFLCFSLPLLAQEKARTNPTPLTVAKLSKAEMGRTVQEVIFYQAYRSGQNLPKDKRVPDLPRSVFPEGYATKGKTMQFFGGIPRQ